MLNRFYFAVPKKAKYNITNVLKKLIQKKKVTSKKDDIVLKELKRQDDD